MRDCICLFLVIFFELGSCLVDVAREVRLIGFHGNHQGVDRLFLTTLFVV